MSRSNAVKITHSSGYTYHSDNEEEFLDVMSSFASALLKSHRTGVKIPRPPFVRDAYWTHNLYSRLWRDYYKGEVEWHFTIDEDSMSLVKNTASPESLQRLVAKEV